ncbi:MAG: hypothetical protein U9P14_03025 [Gemmatimonadota bacterium]|nr:hypothetical protein [Gemmatimonadota bacterium]
MDTPSLFPEFDDLTQLTITDTHPTPLLRDFDIFTERLKARPVTLTKSKNFHGSKRPGWWMC